MLPLSRKMDFKTSMITESPVSVSRTLFEHVDCLEVKQRSLRNSLLNTCTKSSTTIIYNYTAKKI